MLRRTILSAAAMLAAGISLYSQSSILEAFKPSCDSITVLSREHFRVKSSVRLKRALKRGNVLDLYFTQEFSDFPWRPDDVSWIKGLVRDLWPEGLGEYKPGSIFCETVSLDDLVCPAPGSDGKPGKYKFSVDAPARKPFIEESGALKFDRGLRGRNIALWQSHGRFYDNGAECWSWQRSPNWRTTEDLYTQSFVLPFLIPMLERAGAYVLTPRERDTGTIEVICDNDSHFPSPGHPVRTHGVYSERGNWKSAGEGFADRKQVYVKDDNPFTMGTARQAACTGGKANASVRWNPRLEKNGRHFVYISYKTLPESSDCARYTVVHRGGSSEYIVNQRAGGGTWICLGEFDLGPDSYIMLDNGIPAGRRPARGSVVTADAVKIGGGIGKIARGKGKDTSSWEISDMPSYLEGAMYWEQWAGMPYSLIHQWSTDYTCDFASRGAWVKMLKDDRNLPIDLSLAFHTDAGVTPNDSIVGTLSIYTLRAENSRKFSTGGDRSACRMLADFVQTQITDDLRADYDSLWTRRQLWNRSYSESRTTDVPGMLLELLAHQNFADMKFGLDPTYRFDVCRAIYKGMLKFLSTYYGVPYSVAPLPVNSFSATLTPSGKALLQWAPTEDVKESTAEAEGYILYTRTDDGAFDNGRPVKGCSIEIPIEKGRLYSFRIEAWNRGGRSFPSETLSLGIASDEARKVLVVNNFDRVAAPSWFDSPQYAGFDARIDSGVPYIKDISYAGDSYEYRRDRQYVNNTAPGFGACDTDMAGFQPAGNSFDYPAVHGRMLMELGYSFCSMSRKAFESSPDGGWPVVDIICGKQISTICGNNRNPARYQVFPKGLQKAISAAASAGSSILISGAYIATDAWDEIYPIGDSDYQESARNFIMDVLGYKWSTSRGSVNGTVTIDNDNIHFYNELREDTYSVETAGAIRATNGGKVIAKYTNRTGAGVYHDMGSHKVVAWSFPLEIIEGRDDMRKVFKKSMDFFE